MSLCHSFGGTVLEAHWPGIAGAYSSAGWEVAGEAHEAEEGALQGLVWVTLAQELPKTDDRGIQSVPRLPEYIVGCAVAAHAVCWVSSTGSTQSHETQSHQPTDCRY